MERIQNHSEKQVDITCYFGGNVTLRLDTLHNRS